MAETTKMGDEDLMTGATAAAEEETPETAAVEEEEVVEEKAADSPFYKETLEPRLFVTRFKQRPRRRQMNQRISMYVERAKRMLRGHETIRMHGIEEGIATACSVVEILKREGVAVVISMQTNLNFQPASKGRRPFPGQTYLSMDFELGRGENALFVTDRKQRKLVALFESKDPERTGTISKSDVLAWDMGEAFYSTEEEKQAGAELAAAFGDQVTMPEFIKYASAFINHNLRVPVFFTRCEDVFGLPSRGRRGGRRGGKAAADDIADEHADASVETTPA